MSSSARPAARPTPEESDARWEAVKAVHWHDCVPSAETRARAAAGRVA